LTFVGKRLNFFQTILKYGPKYVYALLIFKKTFVFSFAILILALQSSSGGDYTQFAKAEILNSEYTKVNDIEVDGYASQMHVNKNTGIIFATIDDGTEKHFETSVIYGILHLICVEKSEYCK
jgi:hypothetical protein